MVDLERVLLDLLGDIKVFSQKGSRIKLRKYQEQAAEAIIDSVKKAKGRTIVVVFPRQSGKNELQAHIEAFILACLQDKEAELVKVSPTWKPQTQNARRTTPAERTPGRASSQRAAAPTTKA